MASESFKQKSGCHTIMESLKKRKEERRRCIFVMHEIPCLQQTGDLNTLFTTSRRFKSKFFSLTIGKVGWQLVIDTKLKLGLRFQS